MTAAAPASGQARALWRVAEPFHALTYFRAEATEACAAAGLPGFWRGYFAGRAAPLGPVDAGVVVAAFHGFHPDFVLRLATTGAPLSSIEPYRGWTAGAATDEGWAGR